MHELTYVCQLNSHPPRAIWVEQALGLPLGEHFQRRIDERSSAKRGLSDLHHDPWLVSFARRPVHMEQALVGQIDKVLPMSPE